MNKYTLKVIINGFSYLKIASNKMGVKSVRYFSGKPLVHIGLMVTLHDEFVI